MNAPKTGHRRRELGLLCLVSALCFGNLVCAEEQTLPLLSTKSGTYTNVTVTTKKKDYIFILHAGGMGNIRVSELTDEALVELGYATEPKKTSSGSPIVLAKEILPTVEAKLQPIQNTLQTTLGTQLPTRNFSLGSAKAFLAIVAGTIVAIHLFFSYCCHLILIKSKKAPSILCWIPVLQWIPLLRAAEISGWWFLGLLLPVPIVPIMWAFKIAKVRGMGPLMGVLLILPITGFFAFLYLAFKRESASENPKRYQSMSLETA